MKRQDREDYYVRKEPREVTHNAMLVSYLVADVVSSLEDKKNHSEETRYWNCWSTAFIETRMYTLLMHRNHLRADAVFHTS